MKKFSVLIALALLAVAGTGYAVTCSFDNVPAATLLVPYFRVARNGSTGGDIPEGGTDTLIAMTNVSNTGIIVHITVWNKYSKPVVDWNVPMTGYDVAFFRMKDILNGRLNLNPNVQNPARLPFDPCGLNTSTLTYNPTTGFGPTRYIRFPNPDQFDFTQSISIYKAQEILGAFRVRVWSSLDESGDITSFTSPFAANILDTDNRACRPGASGLYSGDFSGYVTLDVVNYCTNYFPGQSQTYTNDAIATVGWAPYGFSPNCLIGDVFYIDPATSGGVIAGDPTVAIEFDSRLDWTVANTFYGRFFAFETTPGGNAVSTDPTGNYRFRGDGREPLGTRYGLRYYSDTTLGLQSWAIVWRGDVYLNPDTAPLFDVDLCDWWANCVAQVACAGFGLYDTIHILQARTFDNDENLFVGSGGPSGQAPGSNLFIFLETQRIALLSNADINPGGFKGGWIDLTTPGNPLFNETYVGVQHSGPGTTLSVGHSAHLLTNQFICNPAIFTQSGNTVVKGGN